MNLSLVARPRGRAAAVTALGTVVVALCALAGPAAATELDMGQLPVVEPFRCTICHVTDPDQTGSAALNVFGSDYLANLRTWDAALASIDSDGDGCNNGIELGDADGDGQVDGNVGALQSNPGVAGDCGGANVDGRTWGELKSLFDRE